MPTSYFRPEKIRPLLAADTETTSLEDGRLIELGFMRESEKEPHVVRCRPIYPIDVDAMATHHITSSMLINEPQFQEHPDYMEIRKLFEESQVIAHNSDFDMAVLKREGFCINLEDAICTKRLAARLHPEFPKHSLQYLRYALQVNVGDVTPHTARGDVLVLMAVFEKLLGKLMTDRKLTREEAIKAALRMRDEPILLTHLPKRFKKHAGEPFVEVNRNDRDYIEWMFKEIPNMDDQDLIHTVEYYTKRRTA